MKREFIERSGGGGRVGIYREVDGLGTEFWYVGKTAVRPIVVIMADGTCILDDLGLVTISTTAGMNAALRKRGVAVFRRKFKLGLWWGNRETVIIEPDQFGRSRYTFNLKTGAAA